MKQAGNEKFEDEGKTAEQQKPITINIVIWIEKHKKQMIVLKRGPQGYFILSLLKLAIIRSESKDDR